MTKQAGSNEKKTKQAGSNEKKTKAAWKSDSNDGAFLFLLFHKRIEHPDDFSPLELQASPEYTFDKYSNQTFK